jgi:hypothetical protein
MIIKKRIKEKGKDLVDCYSNGNLTAWTDVIQRRSIVPHAMRGPAFLKIQ